ncbi:hypothetical protein M0R45_015610 [Rubus argutus]|uniref:Secreted protein n=1 Tax=Rubus argutus TaxID=59490 RepID=A0AAW1XR10_RUBAR
MAFSCFLWLLFSTHHCRHHHQAAVHSSLTSTFFLWINPCNLESILTCKSIISPWHHPFQSTHNIQPKYHSPSHHCNLITMTAAHSINLLSHIFNSSVQPNRARARFICNQPPSITCNITSPSSLPCLINRSTRVSQPVIQAQNVLCRDTRHRRQSNFPCHHLCISEAPL